MLIDLKYFLVSLAIGIFFVYISEPEPKVVVIYPTKDTERQFQFKDNVGNCFEMKRVEAQCTNDAHEIPAQY